MTEHEKAIIAPDWNEQFTFVSIDDLMTSIETSQERAAFALEELLNDFHCAEWDDEMEKRFILEFHRYRVLLDLAFVHNDEIKDHLKLWQTITANYKKQREKQEQIKGELTFRKRINRLLDTFDETSDSDNSDLENILEYINRVKGGLKEKFYKRPDSPGIK